MDNTRTVELDGLMDDILILTDHRPSRADAVKNCELLLQTARRLFEERGVNAVTMSDVAEAAGVGKGTLYRHFASKVDLCHMLIDSDQRNLQNRTLARLREQGDPLADLDWFLREVIAFVIRNQTLIFAEEILGAVLDHPAHVWWRQTTRGLLARINPTLDVDYTADVVFVMLDPRTIHYQLTARGYSQERIADGLIAAVDRLIQ